MLRRSLIAWLLLVCSALAAPPSGYQSAFGTLDTPGGAVEITYGSLDPEITGGGFGFTDGGDYAWVYDGEEDYWVEWYYDGDNWAPGGTYSNPFEAAYGAFSATAWTAGSVPSAWGAPGLSTFGGELSLPDTGVDVAEIIGLLVLAMGAVVAVLVVAYAAFKVIKLAMGWFRLVGG